MFIVFHETAHCSLLGPSIILNNFNNNNFLGSLMPSASSIYEPLLEFNLLIIVLIYVPSSTIFNNSNNNNNNNEFSIAA